MRKLFLLKILLLCPFSLTVHADFDHTEDAIDVTTKKIPEEIFSKEVQERVRDFDWELFLKGQAMCITRTRTQFFWLDPTVLRSMSKILMDFAKIYPHESLPENTGIRQCVKNIMIKKFPYFFAFYFECLFLQPTRNNEMEGEIEKVCFYTFKDFINYIKVRIATENALEESDQEKNLGTY